MLQLTSTQRSSLRTQAHGLDPVVMIGDAGLTESVMKEINLGLDSHGLIKIRVLGDDRQRRIEFYQTICVQLNAAPIQHIGKLLVVYRPKKETEANSKPAKNKGTRKVTILKSGSGAIRNRVNKVVVKGNERVTQGGIVKRSKPRQLSAKKRALSS